MRPWPYYGVKDLENHSRRPQGYGENGIIIPKYMRAAKAALQANPSAIPLRNWYHH